MPPTWYKDRELLWWRAWAEAKVLCRLVGQTEQYVRIRVLWAQPDVIIHTGYGIGEEANVDRRTGTLERVGA
jgi:hypothetical protein